MTLATGFAQPGRVHVSVSLYEYSTRSPKICSSVLEMWYVKFIHKIDIILDIILVYLAQCHHKHIQRHRLDIMMDQLLYIPWTVLEDFNS